MRTAAFLGSVSSCPLAVACSVQRCIWHLDGSCEHRAGVLLPWQAAAPGLGLLRAESP